MGRYAAIPMVSKGRSKGQVEVKDLPEEEQRQQIHQALKETFGFDGFRGQQEAAILAALAGRDCFVLMPTGGGKSLCYSLPALVFDKRLVLVVSPLIALMQDQVSALQRRGVGAAYLSSAQDVATQKRIMDCLEGGLGMDYLAPRAVSSVTTQGGGSSSGRAARTSTLRLLFVTPERLVSKDFRELLKKLHSNHQLGLLAVDEAHCVSSWGHDFRPKYRQMCAVRQDLPGLPVMALTATASAKVREDVMQQLRLVNPLVLLASFNRPNITYSVSLLDVVAAGSATSAALGGASGCAVLEGETELMGGEDHTAVAAMNELGRLLAQHVRGAQGVRGCAIVYVHRRVDADEVVACVQRVKGGAGLRCAAYHAGMKDDERKHVLDQWMAQELDLVAATVAFGMGIDRADVRLVVHWCLAQSLEGYYQESGRAGRDGQPAHAALFYRNSDRSRIDWVLAKEAATQDKKAKARAKADTSAAQAALRGGILSSPTAALGQTSSTLVPLSSAQRAFSQAVAYATTAQCRRRALLKHFDELLPDGGCQGCDYCQNPQAVSAAVAGLSCVALGRGSVQGPSGLSVEAKASNSWRAKAPPGTYGMDDVEEEEEEEDGGSGSRKRSRSDDDDGPYEDEDVRAAKSAALKAGAGTAQGMDSLAFLSAMERSEAAHNRNTGGDVLDRLQRQKSPGAIARRSLQAGSVTIPEAKRQQRRDLLLKQLRAGCCAGLPDDLTQEICQTLEQATAGACTTQAMYQSSGSALSTKCKSCCSVFQLLNPPTLPRCPPKQDDEGSQKPSFSLHGLLATEVKAITTLADAQCEGQAVAGTVSEAALAARLNHLASIEVDRELLSAGNLTCAVIALSTLPAPSVAAAAKAVVKAWERLCDDLSDSASPPDIPKPV